MWIVSKYYSTSRSLKKVEEKKVFERAMIPRKRYKTHIEYAK